MFTILISLYVGHPTRSAYIVSSGAQPLFSFQIIKIIVFIGTLKTLTFFNFVTLATIVVEIKFCCKNLNCNNLEERELNYSNYYSAVARGGNALTHSNHYRNKLTALLNSNNFELEQDTIFKPLIPRGH